MRSKKTYLVTVQRTAVREVTIQITAETPAEAEELAMQVAGNQDFPIEYTADYAVVAVQKDAQ